MDFFYGTVSGNSARSAFALFESGAPFTPHPLDTPSGENRTAAYLALNPMGKIPALIDGELQLWESNAINWYVAEKHPEAGLLPASPGARAGVQRWMFFQAGHLSPAALPIFRATNRRVQRHWKVTGDAGQLEPARNELARYLAVLEAALQGRDWLEGKFSLADIACAPHFWMLAEGEPAFDFAPTPNVKRWLDRLWSRPAWKKTVEATLSGGG
jgi:glutathione S-transferase